MSHVKHIVILVGKSPFWSDEKIYILMCFPYMQITTPMTKPKKIPAPETCLAAKDSLEAKIVEATLKPKKKYRQEWTEYNLAQTKEKLVFYRLLDELLTVIPERSYSFGRPTTSLRTKLFCCMIKTYNCMSCRRTMSDLEMACQAGYIDKVPHFNTILNYFHDSSFGPILRYLIQVSSDPLANVETQFAVDSSAFAIYEDKTDTTPRKTHDHTNKFKKAHIKTGVKTNVVTAAFVTKGNVPDIEAIEPLLKRTKDLFTIKEVMADKGYCSREVHGVIHNLGAIPYIPFKKGVGGKPEGVPIWTRMHNMYYERNAHFRKHYGKRNNVEATFSVIKRILGSKCRSRLSESQNNEILCKILAHNIIVLVHEMFELRIDIDFLESSGHVLAHKGD